MDNAAAAIHERIALQARQLRAARRLSLGALAQKSGVSRSMLSLIERGEASPTAVVLERLATGLGVPLARLFDAPRARRAPSPVARLAAQPRWRDPESGYLRRNVSPPDWPSPLRIVEVNFPAGARVAYETGAREVAVHQQVWVLSGRIEVRYGAELFRLGRGDCLALQLDRPIAFANRSRSVARYAVVISESEPVRGPQP
jgi:transcriptional regulator with XRE-family HTH domain